MTALDRADRRILRILQRNNLIPHRQIAADIGLSTPAVTRRLKRLREQGFIERDISILNGNLLQRPLTVVVQVSADSEQSAALDVMRVRFRECPQVQHCYYVTGDADFVLILNVADMTEYENLTQSLFFAHADVKRFTTLIAMDTIKASQEIVIKDP